MRNKVAFMAVLGTLIGGVAYGMVAMEKKRKAQAEQFDLDKELNSSCDMNDEECFNSEEFVGLEKMQEFGKTIDAKVNAPLREKVTTTVEYFNKPKKSSSVEWKMRKTMQISHYEDGVLKDSELTTEARFNVGGSPCIITKDNDGIVDCVHEDTSNWKEDSKYRVESARWNKDDEEDNSDWDDEEDDNIDCDILDDCDDEEDDNIDAINYDDLFSEDAFDLDEHKKDYTSSYPYDLDDVTKEVVKKTGLVKTVVSEDNLESEIEELANDSSSQAVNSDKNDVEVDEVFSNTADTNNVIESTDNDEKKTSRRGRKKK